MFNVWPIDAATGVAYHLVMALTAAVSPLSGAAAIVLLTVAVRAALLPLTLRAVRGERARARLAPRIAELRTKHADDPAALSAALAELMHANGVSPLAGCLPTLAQLPFFMVLYRVFNASTVDGVPNALLGQALLGVHLGTRFVAEPSAPVFWIVFAALAAIAWWTASRMPGTGTGAVPNSRATPPQNPLLRAPAVLRLLPFGTVLVAAMLPLSAGIYLVTTTAWTAVERVTVRRDRPLDRVEGP